MKTPWFIFIVLLGMCAAIGVTFLTPQAPYVDVVQDDGSTVRQSRATGYQHETFATMRKGGSGAERHTVTLWIGWAFILLNVLFFYGCLALGIERRGRLGPAKAPLLWGHVILAGIFTALIFSYYGYAHEETHTLFLSLPRPTAWMMYAVWPFPIVFMILYLYLFDRWFFTEQDESRLAEIVADQRQSATENV